MKDKAALRSTSIWGGIVVALGQMIIPIGQWLSGAMTMEEALGKAVVGLGALLAIIGVRRKLGEAPR